MRTPTFQMPKLPPPRNIDIELVVGQTDRLNDTRVPRNSLWLSENLRFDTGTMRPRNGFGIDGVCESRDPLTGFGTWRVSPGSGSTLYGDDEVRHKLVYGSKTVALAHGDETHAALFADTGDGLGYREVPLPEGATASPILGVQRPAFFAQFNDRTYITDGFSGLVRYDGSKSLTDAGRIVTMLPCPTDTGLTAFGNSIQQLTGGGHWTSVGGAIETAAGFVFEKSNPAPFGSLSNSANIVVGSDKAVVYYDVSTLNVPGLDFTSFTDQTLLFTVNASVANKQIGYVRIVTSAIAAAAGLVDASFTEANSYTWSLFVDSAFNWYIVPLDLGTVPAAIIANAKWIVFELYRPATDVTVTFGQVWVPGPVEVSGTTWYKYFLSDDDNVLRSVPSQPVQVDFGAFEYGKTIGQFPKSCARSAFDFIDLSNMGASEQLKIYRSLVDPAVTVSDAGDYHLVRTISYAEAHAAADPSRFLFFDTMVENMLRYEPVIPPDAPPPNINKDAPHLILGTRTRMLYAATDNDPNRVMASSIGTPEAVPEIRFSEQQDAGAGGWEEVGPTDGDHIVTWIGRQDEVLIFKRRKTYAWVIEYEGNEKETWHLDPICNTGCIAPKSPCHVPGGIVWASERGIEYLSDASNTPSILPFTREVQRTWDQIPGDRKHLVSCAFWRDENLLLISVPTPGAEQNAVIMVYDYRMNAWAGQWVARQGITVNSNPGQLYVDWRDENHQEVYILRADQPVVERFLLPGFDPQPWSDYGAALEFRAMTGWIQPGKGRIMRVTRYCIDGVTDEWDGSESTGFLDANLRLKIDVRDLDVGLDGERTSRTYNGWYNIAPGQDSTGMLRFEGAAHTDLEGMAAQLTLIGIVAGNAELRIDRFSFEVQDHGTWQRE